MSTSLSIRSIGLGNRGVSPQKMHLHGAIITPTEFIKDGTLVVEGERIVAVHAIK